MRSVLDKMDNSDSDFRYMATSDLLTQLTSENTKIKADHELQKRLCRAVLKLLKDSNSEVQGMATKCLPPLTAFVDLENAVYIVDTLLHYVLRSAMIKGVKNSRSSTPEMLEQKAVHDVASLALKSILRDLSPNTSKAVRISSKIIDPLLSAISKIVPGPNSADGVIDTLELLYELLSRVGSLLSAHHARICDCLFIHFSCNSPLVRKRAISCLASLAAVCENPIFINIVERALANIEQQKQSQQDILRSGIQAISALSKTSGHRLAPHLQILVPILFEYTHSDITPDEDEDLRQHCLQALESFCLRCRREMIPFAEKLAGYCVSLAKYDPNYIMDDEDEDGAGDDDDMAEDDDDDDDDGVDEYDDDDYSDDDDSSWKVRRSAIGCIHAMITSQLFSTPQLCANFGPFLISRFREREESVKLDVFASFDQLLRLCGVVRTLSEPTSVLLFPGLNSVGDDAMAVESANASPEVDSLSRHGPALIRALKKELSSSSSKSKIKAMNLSSSVVLTLPMLAKQLVNTIIVEIKQGLTDVSTGMRTETLLFLQNVARTAGADTMTDHIRTIIPCVVAATDDRYYKVTAECMRFYGTIVSAYASSSACRRNLIPMIPTVFDTAMLRVSAQDQDSEVKDAALRFIVLSVINMFDVVGAERTKELIKVLITRLKNTGTQICSVRHLHSMLLSEQSSNFVLMHMTEIAPVVYSFLRKSDQNLRRAAVELLSIAPTLPPSDDEVLVENISELITDSDLRVTSMALNVSHRIISIRGASIIPLLVKPNSIYPRALDLSMSPLLQGRAIDSLLTLFSGLAVIHSPPLTIENILQALEKQAEKVSFGITTSSARSSPLYCIGKCIVAVCREAETQLRIETTQRAINNINSTDFKRRIFALACLAEFGRGSLLPKEGNEKDIVHAAILEALDARIEEVKTTAAVALGGLASSDGASGIPGLVDLIRKHGHQRYLLLLSLKEVISSVERQHLEPVAQGIVSLLLDASVNISSNINSNNNAISKNGPTTQSYYHGRLSVEESVRTATAECLGLFADACPDLVMDMLKANVKSESADIRAAVAAAVKFAVSCASMTGTIHGVGGMGGDKKKSVTIIHYLGWNNNVLVFTEMIGDPDVMVCKNAIQAVNAIAKSYPNLLLKDLSKTLALIYNRTIKDKSLVRIVDLGPFKHEEDYGLDVRKSAFDCLRTLINGRVRMSIPLVPLLEHVINGLGDQSDVRSIAQLILMTAASGENAAQMVNVMDRIVQALDITLSERLKENTVRQEVERHEESLRGALRAIRAMENVAEIQACISFQALLHSIMRNEKLYHRYEALARHELGLMSSSSYAGSRKDNTRNQNNTMRD